jgi:predicted nucleic acid-binding protein
MSILLSTQALIDLIAGDEGIREDASTIDATTVQISAISIAQAKSLIYGLDPSEPLRVPLDELLANFIRQAERTDRIRNFDFSAADRYAPLGTLQLLDAEGDEVSSEMRMVLATAWANELTVLTPDGPWINTVSKLGIKIRPYTRHGS